MEVPIGRDSITGKSVELVAIKLVRKLLVFFFSPESEHPQKEGPIRIRRIEGVVSQI